MRGPSGRLIFAAALLCASAAAGVAAGKAQWYAGKYKIERADPAPWVDATFKPDANEVSSYVGKEVAIGKTIEGPGLLACPNPNYGVKKVGAEYLFQGALAEYLKPGTTADTTATKLGFQKRPIQSVETGCEGEIDFQFSDHDHAAFALNNMIYWLAREK